MENIELLNTQHAPAAIGPYSQAVKVGSLIYTSGQIALMPDGTMVENNIEKQSFQVLTNLKNILIHNDSDLNFVIKTTIFLVNMDDFIAVNKIYSEFFGEHKPARSTVAVKSLPRNALVEIECIAKSNYNH